MSILLYPRALPARAVLYAPHSPRQSSHLPTVLQQLPGCRVLLAKCSLFAPYISHGRVSSPHQLAVPLSQRQPRPSRLPQVSKVDQINGFCLFNVIILQLSPSLQQVRFHLNSQAQRVCHRRMWPPCYHRVSIKQP